MPLTKGALKACNWAKTQSVGARFSFADVMNETGWTESAMRTYFSKNKFQGLFERCGPRQLEILPGAQDEARFEKVFSQKNAVTSGIDEHRARQLMELAIDEARRSRDEDSRAHPKVGAVLTDARGIVLGTAFRGERGLGDHAEYVLFSKIDPVPAGAVLFVTLEPCTVRSKGKIPCCQRVLSSGVKDVWIGMLDPNPQIVGRGATRFVYEGVSVRHFPPDLQEVLRDLNRTFFEAHRSNYLPSESPFVSKQIPDLVAAALGGTLAAPLPNAWDVTLVDVANQSGVTVDDLSVARGTAFDEKYAEYDYQSDVRFLNDGWKRMLEGIVEQAGFAGFVDSSVLAVGVGNGLEGEGIFEEIEKLTLLDCAPRSVEKAALRFPHAKALVGDAEDLRDVPTGSHDVYISLRAFQSTYFDVQRATREACRVLKSGGLFVISIANGFLGEGQRFIPGLVRPGTKIVDLDRPFELAERIRRQLSLLGFQGVGIATCETEVFVYGQRPAG